MLIFATLVASNPIDFGHLGGLHAGSALIHAASVAKVVAAEPAVSCFIALFSGITKIRVKIIEWGKYQLNL